MIFQEFHCQRYAGKPIIYCHIPPWAWYWWYHSFYNVSWWITALVWSFRLLPRINFQVLCVEDVGIHKGINFNPVLSWLSCNILSKVTISSTFSSLSSIVTNYPTEKCDLHFVTKSSKNCLIGASLPTSDLAALVVLSSKRRHWSRNIKRCKLIVDLKISMPV